MSCTEYPGECSAVEEITVTAYLRRREDGSLYLFELNTADKVDIEHTDTLQHYVMLTNDRYESVLTEIKKLGEKLTAV